VTRISAEMFEWRLFDVSADSLWVARTLCGVLRWIVSRDKRRRLWRRRGHAAKVKLQGHCDGRQENQRLAGEKQTSLTAVRPS